MISKTVSALFVLMIAFSSSWAQDDWKLKKDDDGIKIWTRNIDGSNFKQYKATTEIETNLATIIAVLRDIDLYTEWLSNLSSVRLLDSNQRVIKYYLQTEIPTFLIRDRDLVNVLEFNFTPESQEIRINVWSEPELVPEDDDFIRIHESNGYWLLQQIDSNLTRVTLQMHSEPNGSIPSWLVNSFVVDAPYDDLMALRERVKMKKYENASLSFSKK